MYGVKENINELKNYTIECKKKHWSKTCFVEYVKQRKLFNLKWIVVHFIDVLQIRFSTWKLISCGNEKAIIL